MIFALLTLLAALAVAGVAGWFSIVGVMSIYAGAPLHAALVMGVVLEGAKLVTTSWLYRNWNFSSWKLKAPLIYFTIALMIATSIGVFGFLSKAHLEQGAATVDNSAKIERIEQQIARERSNISDNEKVIAQLDTAINSYLGKDSTDRALAVRRAQAPQRKQLRADIEASQKKIDEYSDEKLKLTSQIRALNLEVGPIRYIADLFYGNSGNDTEKVESAVRLFTLLIVSTLDPLAVILLIAANHTLLRRQHEKEKSKSEIRGQGQTGIVPIPSESSIDGNIGSIQESANEGEVEGPQINVADDIEECTQTTLEEGTKGQTEVDEEIPEENIPTGKVAVFFGADVVREMEEALAEQEQKKQEVSLPTPIIVSPKPSRVEIIEPAETVPAEAEGPSPVEVVEEPAKKEFFETINETLNQITAPITIKGEPVVETVNTVDTASVTAHQESIVRELMGSAPHFLPKKLNEDAPIKEEITKEEITKEPIIHSRIEDSIDTTILSENEDDFVDATHTGNDKEISTERQAYPPNMHPRVLSWLREFKGN